MYHCYDIQSTRISQYGVVIVSVNGIGSPQNCCSLKATLGPPLSICGLPNSTPQTCAATDGAPEYRSIS